VQQIHKWDGVALAFFVSSPFVKLAVLACSNMSTRVLLDAAFFSPGSAPLNENKAYRTKTHLLHVISFSSI
jgi:hypothetical protein